MYSGGVVHKQDQIDATVKKVMGVARRARNAGTRIIVLDPGGARKTDDELQTQAQGMNRLGKELASLGMTLAYHHHSTAMHDNARELHHTLGETDPKFVTYCLDMHWVYRGSGNSQDMVAHVLKRYASRVSELHLRQSVDNVWSETFGEGDIDHAVIAARLLSIGVKPHLVLEQAVEKNTPHKLSALEANRRSCQYVRKLFAEFAG
jgi:inosose dehydratase